MKFPGIFRALESRNYRLFFSGQLVSLVGTWMSQTAVVWLVYQLSGSAFMLGVAGFVSQLPSFVFAPLAGVWIDRWNRHHVLVVTQVLSLLQSLALAFFALTKTIDIPHLLVLGAAQGVINAFDMPARQSLVFDFVGKKEHLTNAIALNSSMFNLARLVGPALAGFAVAAFGAGVCFLIDAASYLAVVASLLAMRLTLRPPTAVRKHARKELADGLRYAFAFAPIRHLLLLVSMVSFWGFSFAVLAPVFAREVFHGDARTLGVLMAGSGLGATLGALYLGTRRSIRGLGEVIVTGGLLQGSGLILFPHVGWLPLAVGCTVLAGMGGVLMVASGNTIVQTLVDDDKRGRVMSLFVMAFTGTMPIGNLAVGFLANQIGPQATLTMSGSITLLVITFFYLRLPAIREAAGPVLLRKEAEARALAGSLAETVS